MQSLREIRFVFARKEHKEHRIISLPCNASQTSLRLLLRAKDAINGCSAGINPNRFIRLLRAKEVIFLSSVSSLLGYNGPHCALKVAKHLSSSTSFSSSSFVSHRIHGKHRITSPRVVSSRLRWNPQNGTRFTVPAKRTEI